LAGELRYPEVRRHIPTYSTLRLVESEADEARKKEAMKRTEFSNEFNKTIADVEEENAKSERELKDKIENSLDKEYVMWECKTREFISQTLTNEGDLRIRGLKNQNTIVVSSSNLSFYLLLRWRNHKGVMFPAWQIGLEKYEQKEEKKDCVIRMQLQFRPLIA
jgi:hypothetical protein